MGSDDKNTKSGILNRIAMFFKNIRRFFRRDRKDDHKQEETRKKVKKSIWRLTTRSSLTREVALNINKCAEDIIKKYYLIPYVPKKSGKKDSKESTTIHRIYHGAMHVSRAAMLIPVFANLRRKYGDSEAVNLTEYDLRLIQIATLFHDSAREGDGKDIWDRESAEKCYHYLIKKGVHKDTAKKIAEACANKDTGTYSGGRSWENSSEHRLTTNKDGTIKWERVSIDGNYKRNIYQKLIHDADCIEIIRARDVFEPQFLDVYKDIASTKKDAFDDLAHIIMAERHLLDVTGDERNNLRMQTKLEYENKGCYGKLEDKIRNTKDPDPNLTPLRLLYANNSLLSEDDLAKMKLYDDLDFDETEEELTVDNFVRAINKGQVFARMVKHSCFVNEQSSKKNLPETNAEKEVRKIMRRPGIATRTNKEDRLRKDGNPNRSTTMIGFGTSVIWNVGYGIFSPNQDDIVAVGKSDFDTGYGKKKVVSGKIGKIVKGNKKEALDEIASSIKTGSNHMPREYDIRKSLLQNEIIMDIKDNGKIRCILFCSNNSLFEESGESIAFRKIQAIHLQQEFEKQTQKKLPIFGYSSNSQYPEKFEYNDDTLVELWKETFKKYMPECWAILPIKNLYKVLVEDDYIRYAKTIYDFLKLQGIEKVFENYEDSLKNKIKDAFEEYKLSLWERHLDKMKNNCYVSELANLFKNVPNDFINKHKQTLKKLCNEFKLEDSYRDFRIESQYSKYNNLLYVLNNGIFKELCEEKKLSSLKTILIEKLEKRYLTISDTRRYLELNEATIELLRCCKQLDPKLLDKLKGDIEKGNINISFSRDGQYNPIKYLIDLYDTLEISKDSERYRRNYLNACERSNIIYIVQQWPAGMDIKDIQERIIKSSLSDILTLCDFDIIKSNEAIMQGIRDRLEKCEPNDRMSIGLYMDCVVKFYDNNESENTRLLEKALRSLSEAAQRCISEVEQIRVNDKNKGRSGYNYSSDFDRIVDYNGYRAFLENLNNIKKKLGIREYTDHQKTLIAGVFELAYRKALQSNDIQQIDELIRSYKKYDFLGDPPEELTKKYRELLETSGVSRNVEVSAGL